MATGGLYGNASESVGLYGNTTNFGGSYFEWFIFYQSDTQPATPTGGSWSFTTNTGTPPTGWSVVPFPAPTLPVWVSIALVNSRSDVPLVWSAPGLFSYSSGLPILSGSGTPAVGDGINSQLYVQTSTTPQTIWFKQSGTWNRLVGSTLYADLTTNQTVAGIKTFSSPIVGSVTGTSANITGIVDIANGGTSSTTASGARSALGVTATGQDTTYAYRANNLSDLASASTARTNLGLGSAAVLTAGAANGVATLDAGGTVPLSQIPASIQGGVSYQGTWNASTNTPTLTSSVGTKGYYYVVSTAGSTNLNGITSWNIGDWAIYNGTAWEKIDNTDAVTSVNGYTGTVVLTQPDIAGTASLTTVQTLTNKTLTSPKINEILDTNGNEILGLSPTASATDFVTVKNGIGVAVPLHIYADGPSTNIGLHLQPKGSGLITISDGTDFNKGIRFRSSGSAASAVTLLDAVSTAGRVVTLPDATTTLVGRDTTDTLTNKTIAFSSNTFSGTLAIANGGTGQATANAAFNALVPSQTGNSGKYLTTNGTDTSWGTNPLGDVVGPASATANGIALFDGTTGKLLKDSASTDGLIYGLTVGRGAGAVATNTAVGASALAANTTGSLNTAIGGIALDANLSGAINTAVGYDALGTNTTGSQNNAFGYQALALNNGSSNNAFGVEALENNLTGNNNSAFGEGALRFNTIASYNTAVGYQAAYSNQGGLFITALGYQAGFTTNLTTAVNVFNTYLGERSGYANVTGDKNTYVGSTSGFYQLGSQNTAVGEGSMFGVSTTSTGSYNTAVGRNSLNGVTSGSYNVAIGSLDGGYGISALNANTTGSLNVAVGNGALGRNLDGGNNVAVGYQSLFFNTTGFQNTATGYQAGWSNTSGIYNTASGALSGYLNQTGASNTTIGYAANFSNVSGNNVTSVGYQSLNSNASASTITAIGYRAMFSHNTGGDMQITAVGALAGAYATSSQYLTAIGAYAGYYSTGAGNTMLGYSAGYSVSSGTNNTYIGSSTGPNSSSFSGGANNVGVGTAALTKNTSGAQNIAIGVDALTNNATTSNNVAVGYQALSTSATHGYQTAVGYRALATVNAGYNNTAMGASALAATTAGVSNVGIGDSALTANLAGSQNIAIGQSALVTNSSGSNNVAIGSNALNNNNASQNTAVGYQAGYNVTGVTNTAVGYQALYSAVTGGYNVGFGDHAGEGITSGQFNVCLGSGAGYGGTTTGNSNVLIGINAQASSGSDSNSITIGGTNLVGKGATTGFISPGGGGVYQGNNSTLWSITSDQRIKKNIVDNNTGLSVINQIQVRNFEYRLPEEITELPQNQAVQKQGVQLGVIAQELQQILPECVKTESTGVMTVDADNLTWYMVNAIKELKAQNDSLKARLDAANL